MSSYQPLAPAIAADGSNPFVARWADWRIDYTARAAYALPPGGVSLSNRARALWIFAHSFATVLAKRAIRYEMIPNDRRNAGGFAFAGAALRNMLGRSRSRVEPTDPAARAEVRRCLERYGIAVVTMPDNRMEALDRAAAPFFVALEEARRASAEGRRAFGDSRGTTDRARNAALYRLTEQILTEAGIMAAASVHLARTPQVVDINPQINDVTDDFWARVADDTAGERLPDTAYFHRDASGGDLKAIIYCSDVGSENGPFEYVVGSQAMPISRLDDWICEANDHFLSDTRPEIRHLFASLPAWAQQKGTFGNDLVPEDALSKACLAHAWRITAPRGSIVLFDTKGIHRGGMVEAGERRVLTCVLG